MKIFKKIVVAAFITCVLTVLMLINHTDNNDSVNYDYKIDNIDELSDTVIINEKDIDTVNIKNILPYLHIDTININTYKDPKIAGYFNETNLFFIHI